MKKIIIMLCFIVLSFGSTYAATVEGSTITNDGGNVTVQGEDTLLMDDVSASEGENVTIQNEDCNLYPEKCQMNDNVSASSETSSDTMTITTGEGTPKNLPETGPNEVLLFFLAILLAFFVLKSKKANA